MLRETALLMEDKMDKAGIDLSVGGESYDSLSDVSGAEQIEMVANHTGKEKCVYFGVVTSTVFYAL
eukprot:CAMPEP_0196814244 /NCGR_PEP_ID=MMETSP1362-20130617/42150_1 /TAXON_ID=163516 /ORGANISM="Leptocylindrus danicus, Strain CCMP1856" /LENGTH=65 /DNA_ID=CAMNT_0042190795 /DNA_START=33 /DNA_END=226 /DNA_ORIENTATION=+